MFCLLQNTALLLSVQHWQLENGETVLLIDSWENQEAIDEHHKSPMMKTIMNLREKYDLHMKIERYKSDDVIPEKDKAFIRK